MSSNFGKIGPQTTELAAIERLKYPHRLIMGKIVSLLCLCCLLTSKYFNDLTCWLSGERSLPFGLLVITSQAIQNWNSTQVRQLILVELPYVSIENIACLSIYAIFPCVSICLTILQ